MAEVVDITELTDGRVLNLAGHERGLAARAKFQMANLDQDIEPVAVLFPENFRQVSSSFFQGMFSASVRHFGSLDAFFGHYQFDAPAHVRAQLADYAEQVLDR